MFDLMNGRMDELGLFWGRRWEGWMGRVLSRAIILLLICVGLGMRSIFIIFRLLEMGWDVMVCPEFPCVTGWYGRVYQVVMLDIILFCCCVVCVGPCTLLNAYLAYISACLCDKMIGYTLSCEQENRFERLRARENTNYLCATGQYHDVVCVFGGLGSVKFCPFQKEKLSCSR